MADSVSFQLPENLTVANVHLLHEELEALVGRHDHDNIVLLADSVSRADTAGIQLLVAFVRSAKERQIKLDWNNPSDKLIAAATVLGLDTALGLH